MIESFFDPHVARRARAASAAGMLKMDSEVHGDVEQRFRLSMIVVWQLAGFELDRLRRALAVDV